MTRKGKFRGTTSYGDSFHEQTPSSPVHPIRCNTEMSRPGGDMNFRTVSGDLETHSYGRPPISRPIDNELFHDDAGDEGYSSRGSRATVKSEDITNLNYVIKTKGNNHLTGYEKASRSVESSMKWRGAETRDLETTNTAMFPTQDVQRFNKVDRNDFVKYVDFGFDSPVNVSVYGGDFKKAVAERKIVMRKCSTISLEGSSGVSEQTTSYGSQFKGEKGSPALPTLTEMDNNLRSSIEFK